MGAASLRRDTIANASQLPLPPLSSAISNTMPLPFLPLNAVLLLSRCACIDTRLNSMSAIHVFYLDDDRIFSVESALHIHNSFRVLFNATMIIFFLRYCRKLVAVTNAV